MSQWVCPELVETWKQRKIKAHHEKESCQTGLVGPKNVSLLEQYQNMVSVGPKKIAKYDPKLGSSFDALFH